MAIDIIDYSVTLNFSNNDDALFHAAKTGVFTSFHMKLESDSPSYYYGFDVLFDNPVALKKDVKYCFEVVISGPDSDVEGLVLNNVECAGVSLPLMILKFIKRMTRCGQVKLQRFCLN